MQADRVGDRQWLLARDRVEIDGAQIARRDEVDAGLARAAQHDAAASDIGEAAAWEQREIEAGGNIGRTVLPVLDMRRQRAEVGGIAGKHDLVNGRLLRRHLDRRLRPLQPLLQRGEQAASHPCRARAPAVAATHRIADELRPLGARRGEQDGARIALEHRGHVHEIDRLVMHLAFAEVDQPLDETAEPKTFDVGRVPTRPAGCVTSCMSPPPDRNLSYRVVSPRTWRAEQADPGPDVSLRS